MVAGAGRVGGVVGCAPRPPARRYKGIDYMEPRDVAAAYAAAAMLLTRRRAARARAARRCACSACALYKEGSVVSARACACDWCWEGGGRCACPPEQRHNNNVHHARNKRRTTVTTNKYNVCVQGKGRQRMAQRNKLPQ